MAASAPNAAQSTAGLRPAPPASLLNPGTFLGALAVFVLGTLIVKTIWPGK